MSSRFLKLSPSEEAKYLALQYPNAFILLFFIAERARRQNGHPDGLTIGQCHIGDHKNMGLSRKEYRTATAILVERGHIKIIETCRTRKPNNSLKNEKCKKSATERATESATEITTRKTTRGTLVQLCEKSIYDINPDLKDDQVNDLRNHRKGHRIGQRGATDGPPMGHEQEGRRKKKKEKEEEEDYAQTASLLRIPVSISFDSSSFLFLGITEKDKADWKVAYPHADLEKELAKMCVWLRANPAKLKKNYPRFIANWLSKASDEAENKKAYRENRPEFKPKEVPKQQFQLNNILWSGEDV